MRKLDWPILIKRITESGMPIKELAEGTGINESTLRKVRDETIDPPPAWNAALDLLDIYLQRRGINPPRLGDHNE